MDTPRWYGYAVDSEAGFVFRFESDYKTKKSVEKNLNRAFSQAVARPIFARDVHIFRFSQEVKDMGETIENIARDSLAENGAKGLEVIECEVTKAAAEDEPEVTPLVYMSPAEQLSELASIELVFEDLQIKNNGYNVWVSGNTKGHKDMLAALGFRYAPKRGAWWIRSPKTAA